MNHQLPLMIIVHRDEDPPDRWGDWFARGERRAACRTCHARNTRGLYREETDRGEVRSRPMCSRCWCALTRVNLTIAPCEPETTETMKAAI